MKRTRAINKNANEGPRITKILQHPLLCVPSSFQFFFALGFHFFELEHLLCKFSLSGKYRPVVVRDGPCTLKQQRFKNPVPHSDQRGMLAVIAKLLDGFHQCKLELFPVSFLPLIRHFLADLEPAFACRSAQALQAHV
jgi:hypothetical protein